MITLVTEQGRVCQLGWMDAGMGGWASRAGVELRQQVMHHAQFANAAVEMGQTREPGV